ncbi:MAG: hypothetical protein EHM55_05810 [Acidobacteria bacterium]|nr:MAG: hypothetical protein EHM55_05810 [Acidobacteriota bacterium]
MVKNSIALSLAAIVGSGLLISAQAPPPSPQQQRPPNPSTPAAQQAATTIVGCVYQEKDVPGRSPNLAEKAGILEDYILAEIKQAPAATPGAAGTAGAAQFGSMYKLELIDDSKLKGVVGKRVEVTGRIDREPGDSAARPAETPAPTQADKAVGRDRVDLAEFEVVSIKEVSGACPASPKAP